MNEFKTNNIKNASDAIRILNNYLRNKTNTYLDKIRNEHLPRLQNKLLVELDEISKACKKYIVESYILRKINAKIVSCKTNLQTEFNSIKQWFYLSEHRKWENY